MIAAPAFPLLSLALSTQRSTVIAMASPGRVDATANWTSRNSRPAEKLQQELERLSTRISPRNLLVMDATRWTGSGAVASLVPLEFRERIRPAYMPLEDACAILGCERTLVALAKRLTEAYPEFAPRFECFAKPHLHRDRVRRTRPLLSALAVAHAASIAQLGRPDSPRLTG